MRSSMMMIMVLLSLTCLVSGEVTTDTSKSLTYLLWFGHSWTGFGQNPYKTPNYLGQDVIKPQCEKTCNWISDRKLVSNAHGVLYEAQPLGGYGYHYLNEPPQFPQKEVDQFYVNFGFEHEYYFPVQVEDGFLAHIDINATFRQAHDVYLTFACSWGQYDNGNIDNFRNAKVVPFANKIKAVGFMSSNCHGGGAIHRTTYILDLMTHIQVDGLGECLHTKDLDPEDDLVLFKDLGKSMKVKEKVLGRYMFALAFENNNITDYVTEKVYTLLLSGTIPIYMGSENIDEYVPSHSVIKTNDFKSPKDLSDYLKNLMENEDEYNKYFEWKKLPYHDKFLDKYKRCAFYSGECALCKQLHKVYDEGKLGQAPGHRTAFGEPESVKGNVRVAQFTHDTCVEIAQNKTYHSPIVGEFTFTSWIYPESGSSDKILFSVGRGNIRIGIVSVWKNFFLFYCYYEDCTIGEKPIPFGQWRHVAVSVSRQSDYSETITLYINGEEDVSLHSSTTLNLPVDTLSLGCWNVPFEGKVDDSVVWNRALSKREIKQSMFKKYRGDESGLMAYFTYNDNTIVDYSKYRSLITQKSLTTIPYDHKLLDLSVC
ncbi:hypothetical protein SAMD00019534_070850, partial [Acytostelium subglobosum LB1]|uniref:hypothetical protein n=1 Tax=Acytostelium subglobosum LB1 TaxID=1410327 RepID=UPI000644DE63